MLDELLGRVSRYTPRTLETERNYPEAAVLLPVTRSSEPELILTLRASGLSTHGGEVAFPGGRRDPEDPDLVFTALREAEEESGLTGLRVEPAIFDLDRHRIPMHKAVPEHWHYDVRFIVCAGTDEAYTISEESLDLAWRNIAELAVDADADPSVRRMAGKWLARQAEA